MYIFDLNLICFVKNVRRFGKKSVFYIHQKMTMQILSRSDATRTPLFIVAKLGVDWKLVFTTLLSRCVL